MKFAMCNELCQPPELARSCRLAADAGYDGLEIAPFTLAESVLDIGPSQRDEIRRTAADHGLEIVGLHWLLASPEGMHLNSPDPRVRQSTVDYLRAEIDLCADLGGRTLVFGSPRQRNVLDGQDRQEVWERTAAAFRHLGARAEARSVVLCVEPLGASETNFIRTAAEARSFIEAVDSPAVKLVLDVKAMCEDEEPIPDIVRRSARWLEHFHANDGNRQGPGFGDTDFAPIAGALREIGYDGWVSVEVFDLSAGPETIAPESLRYLKHSFDTARNGQGEN